jgi:hypothetical protein
VETEPWLPGTVALRQLFFDGFDRTFDLGFGIEDVRRESRAVEPSLLRDLDYQVVLVEQAVAELAAVDRELDRRAQRRGDLVDCR